VTAADDMIPGLVSVVICAYNNWPDVEMAIASALHQSYRSLEVIVVDNSSTDATPEEVPRRFGTRLRYIRQPNRECAGAYNSGFSIAHGEFIQFMDGDDVLAPNKIEKQLTIFRANPGLDIVYGDVRTFQETGGAANWTDLAMVPEDDMLAKLTAPQGIWLNTLGVLFHRTALNKVGAWDECLYVEDADYFLRAAWSGCRFGYCSGSPMGFRRLRPGQKMENSSAMERGIEAVWSKAIGYITREPYRSSLAAKIADWRFHRAVFTDHLVTREALVDLALARATSPVAISALRYSAAYVMVMLPGGRYLAQSQWLGPLRRIVARLF
jgi:glycosyltransferase involved in cell wall biosynthesis